MQIDAALAQYNNRPLKVPGGASSATHAAAGVGVHPSGGKAVDKKSPLYAQCLEFESIFVKMMLKEMRATVDKSADIIGGGFAGDIYQDMLDDEYAKSMSKTAHFGLADDLYRQLA